MASIRKRGNTFTITAYMGYDEQGTQRKKTTTFTPPPDVTAGKAEKLARAFATMWEDKIRGYVALDENRTFSELATWYYETIAPSMLKPNILEAYRKDVQNHIMPRLGREKLKNITPPMLDTMFAEIRRNGNREESFRLKDKALFDGVKRDAFCEEAGVDRSGLYNVLRGNTVRRANAEKIAAGLKMSLDKVFDDVTPTREMSGASVNKLKLNLSAIFTAAVKKEIMRRNPCALVTPPKVDTPPAAYFDEEQSRRFLDALREQDDFQLEVIFNVLLATGLRSGELCALHWDDIDMQTGLLHVRYTLVRYAGKYVRQAPKTAQSERRIVLPAYIVALLTRHKRQQMERRLAVGALWQDSGAVFTNLTGGYLCGTNLNAKLKPILKAAGLPDIHLHSLRHTHASLLINSDVTAKVIADRLGHANTKTTLDTYSHVFAASEVKAMQAVEMALFKQSK